MPLLTRKTINRILGILDNSCFTNAAFELVTPDTGETLASIKFFDKPDYVFHIKSANNNYRVNYVPGHIINVVNVSHDGFEACMSSLKDWTNNIKSELLSTNPLFNEFEDLKKALNDAIDQKYSASYEPFTRVELDKLKSDFEQLNARFEELHEKSIITANELLNIKQTMSELINEADNFPKKVWYRTFGNNMLKLITNTISSSAGQKILEEGTRKLLDIPPPN